MSGLDFPVRIPFAELLGFELMRVGEGEAEIRVAPRAELLNSFDVAHGGVLMTLLDVTMVHAARGVTPAGATPAGFVTVEMKTSFLQPGVGALLAIGKVLHRSATLAFCEGTVRDGGGRIVAHATATFKAVRAVAAGRSVQPLNGAA